MMKYSTEEKLDKLGDSAKFDISCSCCSNSAGRQRDPADPMHKWIYPAALPGGETIPILKILITNFCVNDCKYCIVCTQKNDESVSFEPEELASLFISMYRKKLVRGIFISSATGIDTTKTMNKIITSAEIIRLKYGFKGYMHLKILPGVAISYAERAMQLADRVSINLEAPNSGRLKRIAGNKDFDSLLGNIKQIGNMIRNKTGKTRAQTTQFVVGAADESDKEILVTTRMLYKEYNLWRTYYSAFQPVKNTPLEDNKPVPLTREHRLYQTDFLFRKYGFDLGEIIFDGEGNLPLEKDPKYLWAVSHPELFPVEINKADIFELVRVPGIGPLSARRLVELRRNNRIINIDDLKVTGMRLEQARDFILVNGKLHSKAKQLELAI